MPQRWNNSRPSNTGKLFVLFFFPSHRDTINNGYFWYFNYHGLIGKTIVEEEMILFLVIISGEVTWIYYYISTQISLKSCLLSYRKTRRLVLAWLARGNRNLLRLLLLPSSMSCGIGLLLPYVCVVVVGRNEIPSSPKKKVKWSALDPRFTRKFFFPSLVSSQLSG